MRCPNAGVLFKIYNAMGESNRCNSAGGEPVSKIQTVRNANLCVFNNTLKTLSQIERSCRAA